MADAIPRTRTQQDLDPRAKAKSRRDDDLARQSQRFKYNPELNSRNFNEKLDEYRLANWSKKELFLPTMTLPEPGSMICEELVRIVESGATVPGARQRLRIMLHAGIPVNLPLDEQKTTMLHVATRAKDEITCRLLLSFGADPEARDEKRDLPFEIARRLGLGNILCLFEEEEVRRKEAKKKPDAEEEGSDDGGVGGLPRRSRDPKESGGQRTRLRSKEPNFMGD